MTEPDPESEVGRALRLFLDAFERGDTEAMRSAFADDALSFPRSITGAPASGDAARFMRVPGIDPEMLRVAEGIDAAGTGRDPLRLEPEDLDVRIFGDVALATFHLVDESSLGRRTLVFREVRGAWKIVHAHASNVRLTGRRGR